MSCYYNVIPQRDRKRSTQDIKAKALLRSLQMEWIKISCGNKSNR